MANSNQVAVQAIKQAAAKYGIDPQAMIAVASVESGLRPDAIGDGGHAYGLFQFNNAGGTITGDPNPRRYLDPSFNAMQAARHIAGIKGIKGAKGGDAIKLIVNEFERPADKQGEIQKALSYYGKLGGGDVTAPTINSKPSQTPSQTLSALGQRNILPTTPTAADSLLSYAMQGSSPGSQGSAENGSILNILTQPQDEVTAPTISGTDQTVRGGTAQQTGLDKTNSVIVDAAKKFLGTPYLWGGTSAKGLDCSGLVQLAVKNATGEDIPRVASDQYRVSQKVPVDKMQPGDIIAFGTKSNVHHIGIYVGNGKFINAPHTGTKVRIDDLAGRSDVVGAGRFPSGGANA